MRPRRLGCDIEVLGEHFHDLQAVLSHSVRIGAVRGGDRRGGVPYGDLHGPGGDLEEEPGGAGGVPAGFVTRVIPCYPSVDHAVAT